MIVLYGLRSGALLAATGAARDHVDALVLHALPPSGRQFIRELRAFRRMAAASGLDDPSLLELDPKAEEAAGYVLWGGTVDALSKLDLATRPDVADCLFVAREDLAADEAVAQRWSTQGRVTRIEPGGYSAMMQDPHKADVPEAAWSAIADWVDALPAHGAPSRTRPVESALLDVAALRIDAKAVTETSARVREHPITFGDGDRLFGILTEPTSTPTRAPVLLLNSGAVHRVGPNRMHVLWARAWAALGHRVLRVDIGGIGDSASPAGQPENLTYAPTGVADVQAAIDELGRRDERAPTLIGICSGAYVTFHAARTARIARAVLINPQTFDYKEGDSLDVASARVASEYTHYRRSLFSVDKWKKLVGGQVDLRHIAEVVFGRACRVLSTRVETFADASATTTRPKDRSVASCVGLRGEPSSRSCSPTAIRASTISSAMPAKPCDACDMRPRSVSTWSPARTTRSRHPSRSAAFFSCCRRTSSSSCREWLHEAAACSATTRDTTTWCAASITTHVACVPRGRYTASPGARTRSNAPSSEVTRTDPESRYTMTSVSWWRWKVPRSSVVYVAP